MNCLFCDNKIVDNGGQPISISKNCEFSFYRRGFCLHYYVCINKRIAIVDNGCTCDWVYIVKEEFFPKGAFILYDSVRYNAIKLDYRPFLERGFVF